MLFITDISALYAIPNQLNNSNALLTQKKNLSLALLHNSYFITLARSDLFSKETLLNKLLSQSRHELIFTFYLIFFASMFLTNYFYLPFEIFTLLVCPIALCPVQINKLDLENTTAYEIKFSLAVIRQYLMIANNKVFYAAVLFIFFLLMSTFLAPSPSLFWLRSISYYSLSIILFLLITAELYLNYKDFILRFLLILTPIISFNAIINLTFFISQLVSLNNITSIPFTPIYGRVPDHYSTTGSLPYALYLVAGISAIQLTKVKLEKYILSISAVPLLAAVILSQCRGSIIALIFSLILGNIFQPKQSKYVPFAITGIIILILIFIPNIGASMLERGLSFRSEMWQQFLKLAIERPILGYGERIEFFVNAGGHAHNLILSAQVRGGIVSGLAMLFLYIYGSYCCIQYLIKTNNPLPLATFSCMLIAGLVDYDLLVFLTDWQWACFWFPIALCLASSAYLNPNAYHLNSRDATSNAGTT